MPAPETTRATPVRYPRRSAARAIPMRRSRPAGGAGKCSARSRRSAATGPVIPERIVPFADGVAPADLVRALDECLALGGVACDPVEQGAERPRRLHPLIFY